MKISRFIFIFMLLMLVYTFVSAKSSTYALIIAVGDYSDESILDIDKASEDAREIKNTFIDLEICDLNEIKLLDNPSLMQMTVELEKWAKKDVQNLILYYTGHGFGEETDKGSDSFILAADSYSGNLEFSSLNITEFLRTNIDEQFKAKNTFLFIDSCYSGGITADLSLKNLSFKKVGFEKLYEEDNFQFILSSGKDETSLLRPDGGGYFTYFLIEGLKGAANQSGDGDEYIQIKELGDYIKKQVVYNTEDQQHPQTYTKEGIIFSEDMEGKLKKIQKDIFNAYMNDDIEKEVYDELVEFFKKNDYRTEYDRMLKSYIDVYYEQKDLEGLAAKTKNLMSKFNVANDYTITTIPAGSDVYLDGEFIGKSPVKIELSDDDTLLKIEKRDYLTKEILLDLEKLDDELFVELEREVKGVCYLTLSAGNDICIGSEVFIDDEKMGVLGENGILIQGITVGEHVLTVDSPKIKKHEEIILFKQANELKKMEIMGETVYRTVLLFTNPLESTVYVNDEQLYEKTPLTLDLEVGNIYRIRVEKYGYAKKQITLDINEKGTPFKEEIQLEKNKAPLVPERLSPNSTDEIKNSVELRWECDDKEGDPIVYDVFIGKNGNLKEVATSNPKPSFKLDGLEYDTAYSWQIIAKDPYSQSKSPLWSFRTTKAPTQCEYQLKSDIQEPYDVYINDRLFSNQAVFLLQEGDYRIMIKKTGYDDREYKETITWNDVERGKKTLEFDLIKAPVQILVNSAQEKSTVIINGTFAGKTPYPAKLEWGKTYHITVVKEGYHEQEETVTFGAKSVEKDKSYDFDLKKIPSVLNISSSEPETKVFINGKLEGFAPLKKEIFWGEQYEVKTKKEGYKELEEQVKLGEYRKAYDLKFELVKQSVEVIISVVPDTANLFVDRKTFRNGYAELIYEWGKTLTVICENPGYQDKTEIITILKEDVETGKTLNLHMEKIPAKLNINSNVTRAEVLLDSIPIGYTPLTLEKIWGDHHKIEISEEGYETYLETVDLRQFRPTQTINAELKKKKVTLNLDSDPQGATVYLDDVQIGITPFEYTVEWGKHEMLYEKFGYLDVKKTLDLKPGDIGTKKIVTQKFEKKKATVQFKSYPSEAQVFIDNVMIGTTPLELNLYPEKYSVMIQKDKYDPISEELKIGLADVYKKTEKQYHMEKKDVEVEIKTVPEDARVALDGMYKGNSPLILRIPWGEYGITVSKPGFFTHTHNYTFSDNTFKEIVLEKHPITLSVISNPTGAGVFINDIYHGVTPLNLNILSGDYSIMLKKDGYQTQTRSIAFPDSLGGAREELEFYLPQKTASINLNVNLSDAWVTVNGNVVNKHSFLLDAGVYWLEVGKDGYTKFGRKLEIVPGDVITQDVNLVELDTTIDFKEPLGADILVDGKVIGRVPELVSIEPGNHQIAVRRYGAKLIDREINISAGDRLIITGKGIDSQKSLAMRTGKIVVKSSPSDAQVFIDGEYHGNTPLEVEKEIGMYSLQLKLEGYGDSEIQTIYLEQGQTVNQSHTLQKISGFNNTSKEQGQKIAVIGDIKPEDTRRGTLRFTEPKSMSIYIDDVFKGWVPMDIQLTPGEYKVSIEDANERLFAQQVTVKADELVNIQYKDKSAEELFGMVFIPKGYYITGNDSYDNGADKDEFPSHESVITYDYYIYEHEVTNEEFCSFMNEMALKNDGSYNGTQLININTSDSRIYSINGVYYVEEGYETYPVVNVSWIGACYFANFVSEMKGYAPAYDDNGDLFNPSIKDTEGYRLPTEAEWEYAAFSAGKERYLYSGSNEIDEVAVYVKNANREPRQVMSKRANESGIYDMSGNIAELCYDAYAYYPDNKVTDWYVTSSGRYSKRVLKGGSFKSGEFDCRIKDRDFINQQSTSKYVGFRLVMTRR